MTAAFETQLKMLPTLALRESPLNPRKHFSRHALEDLASSIREKGIITPLIVRPMTYLSGDGYEIGAGHRRFRAAAIAGLDEVPCIVRDLNDDEFLELLTIENDQREDVHPLEQALGYRELLKRPGYDVARVAEKIGRPEAFVYGRLQLCDLVPVVQESFLRDDITIGHAKLIARLQAAVQEKALERCFQTDYYSKKPHLCSVRDLKDWIRRSAGSDLGKAPFDRSDPHLVEKAGPCTSCPKGSGVNRLLFDADGEELCFDVTCYEGKVQAHIAARASKGLVAISTSYLAKGVPAGVLVAQEYETIGGPDELLVEGLKEELASTDLTAEDRKSVEEELAAELRLGADCGYSELAVVAHSDGTGRDGQEVRICRDPKCPEHGKRRGGSKDDASAESKRHAREAEERSQKQKAHRTARERALEEILGTDWSLDCSFALGMLLLQHFLKDYWNNDKLKRIATRFSIEVETPKGESSQQPIKDALIRKAEKWPPGQRNQLIVALLLDEDLERTEWNHGVDVLAIAAEENGIDLAKLERVALRELTAPKAAKPPAPSKSLGEKALEEIGLLTPKSSQASKKSAVKKAVKKAPAKKAAAKKVAKKPAVKPKKQSAGRKK